MNNQELPAAIGFITFFLVLTLGFTIALGEKAASWFLGLVLLGMLIVNADKVTQLASRFSSYNQPPAPSGVGGGIDWTKLDASGGMRA